MSRIARWRIGMLVLFLALPLHWPAGRGTGHVAPPTEAPPPYSVVETWGEDDRGQLGVGHTGDINFPVTAHVLTQTVMIAAGGDYTLALERNGSVYGWGDNTNGNLGIAPESQICRSTLDNSNCYVDSPVRVPNLPPIVAVAASGTFESSQASLAVDRSGYVWSWGWVNTFPTVSYGTCCDYSPRRVPGLSNVQEVATDGYFAIALKRDGTVWSWPGRPGTPPSPHPQRMPAPVPRLVDIVAIAWQWERGLALRRDGTLWAWGYGPSGIAYIPQRVEGLPTITSIAVGDKANFAIATDGTVWGWLASSISSTTPMPGSRCASMPGGNCSIRPHRVPSLTNVRALAAYENNGLALRRDGTVLAWGFNRRGQLGIGRSSIIEYQPQRVLHLSRVIAIAIGPRHGVAVVRR